MNIEDLKTAVGEVKNDMQEALLQWSCERIDDFAKGKPALITFGEHLKRRIRNEVVFNSEGVDRFLNEAALWVVDGKDGNADLGVVVDDAIAILKNVPESPFNMGMLRGTFGGGKVSFLFPKNILTSALLGESNCITLKEADFIKIKEFLV